MKLLRASGSARARRLLGALLCVVIATSGCTGSPRSPGDSTARTPATQVGSRHAEPAEAGAVQAVVRNVMAHQHLRAAIVKVTVGGRTIIRQAWGNSMAGVPATANMHFRNGAVAISYIATLLLELVDQHKVRLTDKVSTWLPRIPHSSEVTLGQLAQMTAGYADYVTRPQLDATLYADPFATITEQTRLGWISTLPLVYEPGTNWNYSHTDYVILGMALAKITGQPLATAIRDRVLEPLGLRNTDDPGTPAIPQPVLHAYTAERRDELGIPTTSSFVEDSTFWNPSWTLATGAIEYTDIDDLNATAIAVGTGTLLRRSSYRAMITKDLVGRTTRLPGCTTCFPQSPPYTYGLGVVSSDNWLMQNPLFAGEAGSFAYLPSRRIAIAVEATFEPAAFGESASPKNAADLLWRKIGAVLAPSDAPPMHP